MNSNATIVEGVDNDVLLAFLTLLIITIATVIYYLHVNRSDAAFNSPWVNFRTFISRQITRLQSFTDPSNQGESSSETTEANATNNQRTNQTTNHNNSDQLNAVDNENSEQSEESLRETVGEHPEDIPRGPSQECPHHGNINSKSTESQGGEREEGGERGSGENMRQRTGFGSSSAQCSSDAQSSDSQVSVRVKHHEVERSFTVDPNITVRELKR